MIRAIQIVGLLVGLLIAGYVGSFAVLVHTGREYARRVSLDDAYFLADPDADGGVERHYRRGRFYFPRVYVCEHWTHGPYFVHVD